MMQSNQIIASLFSNMFEPVQKVMQSNQIIASLFLAYVSGLAWPGRAWAGLGWAGLGWAGLGPKIIYFFKKFHVTKAL
jgi:hypothetical protein